HRRLLVYLEPDAMAGVVVHLRHSVRSFIAMRLGAVAAIDQDLTHGLVYRLGRHAGTDRLLAGLKSLHRGGVHAEELFGDLADHNRPREIAVIVARAPERKDVDYHRRAGADLSLAAGVRPCIFGRARDAPVRAGTALRPAHGLRP